MAYTVIALQELNLYNKYPSVYWNTACLIVNSGDESGTSTDYSKMAVALGAVMKHGIKIGMVDINESEADFSPNPEANSISYGLRPLSGVGAKLIDRIQEEKPFSSLDDFIDRIEPTKAEMLNLIKAGAFMKIDNLDRRVTMAKYAKTRTATRKNLSISQLPLVVKAGLLPEELESAYQVYEFNRYVKEVLRKSGQVIILDERAQRFLASNGYDELIEVFNDWTVVSSSVWTKTYDKAMNPVRAYFKANKESILKDIFIEEVIETFKENGGLGTYEKWEMDSMNFYYTGHELANVDFDRYGISNYSKLPREPIAENPYAKFSKNVLSIVIGTVISKNKTKGELHLLTPEGSVVLIKMYKGDFSYWDKQVSRQNGSKKEVIEKSFFERGNKVMFTGFRRGDQFVPKVYSSTPTPMVALITDVSDKGEIAIKADRESI